MGTALFQAILKSPKYRNSYGVRIVYSMEVIEVFQKYCILHISPPVQFIFWNLEKRVFRGKLMS